MAGTAEDPALAGFERGVVARAFHSLPERWQAVLWHTEVEGLSPAEIAPILGLTANGVAALAYRAREGLRQAYLQQHLQDPLDEGCRAVAGKLGSYVRGGLGTRETAQVEAHLEDCGTCRGLVLELGDVNHGMRAVIAPLVLGLVGLGALGVLLPGRRRPRGRCGRCSVRRARGAGAAGAGGAGAAGAGGAAGAAARRRPVRRRGRASARRGDRGGRRGRGRRRRAVRRRPGASRRSSRSIPLGAAAVAVGSVALAAVRGRQRGSLLSSPDGSTATAPTSSGASPTHPGAQSRRRGRCRRAAPQPTDCRRPSPRSCARRDRPRRRRGDDPDGDADRPTAAGRPDRLGRRRPTPTDPVPTPPTPRSRPPPDVGVELPDGGLALEAGLAGQELSVGVRNNGGTAATDLVAEVTLPAGVTLDGISAAAFTGPTAGRFARDGVRGLGLRRRGRDQRARSARSTRCRR